MFTDFAALPPETVSAQMYAGPGSGPMLAAAAAWDALAAELHSAASGCGTEIAGIAEAWRGPASAAMTAAVAPYPQWLAAAAAQARLTATSAATAAAAYEDAFAATVPPPLIAANRSQLATLLATNVFGQNTAAIAAVEAQYGQMWLQNATAMNTYAAAAAAALPTTGFTAPPLAASSPLAVYEEMFAAVAAVSKASTFANASMSVPNLGMVQFKTFFKPTVATVDIPTSALGAALRTAPPAVATGLTSSVSAAAREANLVGRLSVPPSWATATPAIRMAATALPDTSAVTASGAEAARSLLPATALGGVAGAALGGSAPRLLDATRTQGRAPGAGPGTAPVRLDRVIAHLQKSPNSVRHWNVDQDGLDDLIAELSTKPGVHAVHLAPGGRPCRERPTENHCATRSNRDAR